MKNKKATGFKANVYPRDPDRPKRSLLELNMVRGAHNGVTGYAKLKGRTNRRFLVDGRLQFEFPTRRKRRVFMRAVRSRMRYLIVRRVVSS